MESFNDIINGPKPVLIDFFATWCGPCKMMAPTIDAIGKEMGDQIRVLKIDIDKNRSAATHYNIQSVPTLMIFKNGQSVWRISGAMSKNDLISQLKKYL